MSYIRAFLKLAGFALWSLLLVPPQIVIMAITRGSAAFIVPRIWHRGVCTLLGVRVSFSGRPLEKGQVFYVFNHLSYLDIPVIGGLLNASFIAKKEVRSWPVFGFLARLQQTAFIDRARRSARQGSDQVSEYLERGRNLILFAEGTSTDGRSVWPFKSSLFGLIGQAPSGPVLLQPATIRIVSVGGKPPETQNLRDLYAWHIKMDAPLPAHLWRFARSRGAHIHIMFHPPLKASPQDDRKELARQCHKIVAEGLEKPVRP